MGHQLGIAAESTYGTFETPARFLEFNSESLARDNTTIVSNGIRPGAQRGVRRDARRVLVGSNGAGSVEAEVAPSGFGLILENMLGSVATVETEAATRWTHTFTLGDLTGTSLTVQKGVEASDGDTDAFSFLGSKVTQWGLSVSADNFLMVNLDLHAREVVTSESLAVATYPAGVGASPLHFAQATLSKDASAITSVSSFEISGNNALDTDRRYLGNAGLVDEPTNNDFVEITGQLTAEFDDPATFYDEYAADTSFSLEAVFTGPALGAGNYQLTITLPSIKLTGATPQVDSIAVPDIQPTFMVLDDDSNEPITIELVNGDSAP